MLQIFQTFSIFPRLMNRSNNLSASFHTTLSNMSQTMKQVINYIGPKADLTSGPVPEPSAKQVLIKVIVSGSNPKDWKAPEFAANYDKDDGSLMASSKKGVNQGDDIAGIVEAVGQDVLEFKASHQQDHGWNEQLTFHQERRPCCSVP